MNEWDLQLARAMVADEESRRIEETLNGGEKKTVLNRAADKFEKLLR